MTIKSSVRLQLMSVQTRRTHARFNQRVRVISLTMRPCIRRPMSRQISTKRVFREPHKVHSILQLRIMTNHGNSTRLFNSLTNVLTRARQHMSVRRIRAVRHLTGRHITQLNRLRLLLLHRPTSRQRVVSTHKVFKHTSTRRASVVPLTLRLLHPLRHQVQNTVTPVPQHISRRNGNRKKLHFVLLVLKRTFRPAPVTR